MPDFRGGPPPEQQFGDQVQPGLLQMAQSAMSGDGRGGGPMGGQYENAWDNPANWGPPPQITGPMPASQQGWFPEVFKQHDPQGKFWSWGDYMRQYQQKYGGQLPEVMDERHVNTINSQMLANPARPNEPGAFMYLGHHISPGQMIQDLQQGQNPPAGAEGGGNRPPIRRGIQRYGSEYSAAFPYGGVTMIGLPGQLEPWATGY